MARTFWQGVLVTILWLCVAVRTGAEMTDLRTITCFARAVSMGGPGVVTCHFPVAITQSGSITVDHYSLDGEVPGSVFDCLGNVKECEPNYKYKILSADGTDLVFGIPTVTEDYMGTYRCQMELKGGAGRLNAGACDVTITGTVPTTNTSPSTTVGPSQSGTVKGTVPTTNTSPSTTVGPSQSGTDKDSGSDEKRDVGPNVPAIAVVVCVCVVIVGAIVGAIVGCLVYRRRRIRQCGQSPEKQMEENGREVVELEAREQRGEHEAGGEHGSGPSSLQQAESRAGAEPEPIRQRDQSPGMPMEESGRGVGEPEAQEQRGEHEAGGEHGSSGPSSLQQAESRAGAEPERIRQRDQSPEMRMEESGRGVVELEAQEQRDEHEAGGEHGDTEEETVETPEKTPEEEEEKEPLLLPGTHRW
ncbi:uncharacterized protein LOC143291758 isoform X2 [Babylonia areolata]|uniref:uncharacterized protein LOC143291758 isoform X2 n=1 Tax=Babylonia areolata TaxID=304850 RepID=UPI003FD22608